MDQDEVLQIEKYVPAVLPNWSFIMKEIKDKAFIILFICKRVANTFIEPRREKTKTREKSRARYFTLLLRSRVVENLIREIRRREDFSAYQLVGSFMYYLLIRKHYVREKLRKVKTHLYTF